MGMRFQWEWELYLNERGNGNRSGNPTGWEWKQLILAGSQIIPINLLNHSVPVQHPELCEHFTSKRL